MGGWQHNIPTAKMAALPSKALDGEPLKFSATARVKLLTSSAQNEATESGSEDS
jgi:hypothetical protein